MSSSCVFSVSSALAQPHLGLPAQQKTSWPFGAGGCERTRCGVRRQVSSRSEVVAFMSPQLSHPAGRRQGVPSRYGASPRGSGEPKRSRLPSASVCAASQTPKPGSKRSLVSPTPGRPPLRVQGVGVVDRDVGRAALLGLAGSSPAIVPEVDADAVPLGRAVAAPVRRPRRSPAPRSGRASLGSAVGKMGAMLRRVAMPLTLPWAHAPALLTVIRAALVIAVLAVGAWLAARPRTAARPARRRACHRQPRHLARRPAQPGGRSLAPPEHRLRA